MSSKRKPHPSNADGPFYVEDGCCTACGVPQTFARELFDEDEQSHCFVRRQPETDAETDAMIRVVANQELGCIRYRGVDPSIQRRLVEANEAGQCDVAPPRGIQPLRRDHVSFVPAIRGDAWSGRAVIEQLVRYLSQQPQPYKSSEITVHENGALASVSISWFEDDFHRVEAIESAAPRSWLVRHSAPPRFSDTLHDWLTSDDIFVDIRWQTRAEWEANGLWRGTPW